MWAKKAAPHERSRRAILTSIVLSCPISWLGTFKSVQRSNCWLALFVWMLRRFRNGKMLAAGCPQKTQLACLSFSSFLFSPKTLFFRWIAARHLSSSRLARNNKDIVTSKFEACGVMSPLISGLSEWPMSNGIVDYLKPQSTDNTTGNVDALPRYLRVRRILGSEQNTKFGYLTFGIVRNP